ncbi:site-specific DNA-methyltransferase [Candidatus Bathyarchaeota archaeon]|nr:site-specific DNA-methyltransferase [Candidatus Bathyarchaeota archaeon]
MQVAFPEEPEKLSVHDIYLLIPTLCKDVKAVESLENKLKARSTIHHLVLGDSRNLSWIEDDSIGLVVTSPPYWTLKKYDPIEGQLGVVEDYEEFLKDLDRVWKECFRVLVAGGRLVIVVGDVCLSRRKHLRHRVMPLHADIQIHCRNLGLDNLAPIFWYKVANASYEAVGNGGSFLGKPYEPNAVVKNDVEFILMERKPGKNGARMYRKPNNTTRLQSIISDENHKKWFRQIWEDVQGASTRRHPAPFPEEIPARLIRMFSFAGDTILDPFNGTATTMVAAAKWGRNSIGVEIVKKYVDDSRKRLAKAFSLNLFSNRQLIVEDRSDITKGETL